MRSFGRKTCSSAHPLSPIPNPQGIPVLSELAFSFACLPASLPVAAVSGTNGKSTVATFTGQLLEGQGVRAFVGGNLGTPLAVLALQYVVEARGRDMGEQKHQEQAKETPVQVSHGSQQCMRECECEPAPT